MRGCEGLGGRDAGVRDAGVRRQDADLDCDGKMPRNIFRFIGAKAQRRKVVLPI